mgnify:CR=1 FL=1
MKDILKFSAIGLIVVILGVFIASKIVGDEAQLLGGITNYDALDVTDGYYVDAAQVIDGNGSFISTLVEKTESVTAINVMTVTESGKTIYLNTTGASSTLPAVASSAGVVFRFVVGSALTGNATINSAEGDNIEGTLIVAGAVVDCDATDTITVVADGENLGDFVEIRSNGSKWFIGASGALTASKMTCTG